MTAIVVQTNSFLRFHNLSCFANHRKCKNPIFSPRDFDWSIEGKDIRLTVSCVGSDGNIKRSSKSSRRKERNDEELENDRKHKSSSQEDIIAIFRRIQSSISKDQPQPIKYDSKNANDSDENSPAASILKVLGESGKKQGRARLSNNNTIYTRKTSVTKKEKGLHDFTQVAESKSKRPLSKFVKRSPIPYPTRPRELSLELKNEMSLTIDGAEEELEPPRLERMKVAQLKEIAKSRGVKGYSKLKKSELISLLQS